MRWARRMVVVVLLLAGLALPVPGRAQGPVVNAYLFFSDSCPHCHRVWDEFLPPLLEQYGDSLRVERILVDELEGYRLLQYVDAVAGVPRDQRGVPQMLIGERILIGSDNIEEHFVPLVEHYLERGGFELPSREELVRQMLEAEAAAATPTEGAASPAPTTAAQPTPTAPPAATSQPTASPPAGTADNPRPIYLAYFFQPGCDVCSQAELDLKALEQVYPQLVVERYSAVDDAGLAEWLGEQYGVPQDLRLVAPAVYVGGEHLMGNEANYEGMEALIRKYLDEGAPRTWEGWEQERAAAEARVVDRYRSFGLLTVVAAGLVDGVNPCAFATLVFFVSYLTVMGRGRRQILATGIAFTAAVFATYLLIGLGLYRLLATIPAIATAGRVIYAITAVVCLALALLSLYDFWQARKGQAADMALRLPTRLRRQVNRVIRESMGPGRAAGAALVAGVLVSVVELACTGQIYLPTLMFVAGRPELRATAVPLLAAYNLAFVAPLVMVFGVTAYGVGSDRLRLLLARHTATVKLLTAALFLGLAAWLVTLLV
ncbi:MAG: hypothetical protein HPY83_05485 [Anaerolineae bacterium]|nr:hypothetical protein [Anaerolineae bacterium]